MPTITQAREKDGKILIKAAEGTAVYSFLLEDNAELEANLKRKLSMLHRTGINSPKYEKDEDLPNSAKHAALIGKTEADLHDRT